MQTNWKNFWENYKKIEVENEDDLFFQVGKTSNQKPISNTLFEYIIHDIHQKLNLKTDDQLLEMCCGNGLFTFPLSLLVNHIYAFDFTENLIQTAEKFKKNNNITYAIGDANQHYDSIFLGKNITANKFLMNDASAYFLPEEVENIINRISETSSNFRFYMTNIPDDDKKWIFYNTPERQEQYENAVKSGDVFLGGIGRWWKFSELEKIAESLHLKIEKSVYEDPTFSYRMNILFYN